MVRKKKPRQRPQVGVLGKELTRRSRGCCELCSGRDGARPFELWPFPEEPEMDRTLMACRRCRSWLEGDEIVQIEAHFLSMAVWSDQPAVRLAAARLLLDCDDPGSPWLRDALDSVEIDGETREFRC